MYNILLVEENIEMAGTIKEIMKESIPQSRIMITSTGEEMWKALKTYDIDIISLSLSLPENEGCQLLEQLPLEESYATIPIIVSSTAKDMDKIKKALTMGASDYFIKSLHRDYMSMIISMVLKNTLELSEQKRELEILKRVSDNEFKIAGFLQKSMLSIYNNKETPEIELKAYHKPVKNISSTLFDFKRVNNKNWFFMVDSKGNNMIQLMISILLRAVFNEGINRSDSPGEVMTEMNRQLFQLYPDMEVPFSSCIIGKIENHILTYSNAGFPHPEILSEDNREARLSDNWHMLGFDEDTYYIDYMHILKPEECLLLYTDGLLKNKKDEEFKPEEAMEDIRNNYKKRFSLNNILNGVLEAFYEKNLPQQEDVSLAILKMKD